MKIYTGTGDEGYTSLLDGTRVAKNDIRIDLIGNLDQVTSFLGFAKNHTEDKKLISDIEEIQKLMMEIMADIAESKSKSSRVDKNIVDKIEKLIDEYQIKFEAENKFIIPGKNKTSAILDVTRTIVRNSERKMVQVAEKYPLVDFERKYINRLSDFLYTAARYIDFKEEITEEVVKILNENYKFEGSKNIEDTLLNKGNKISLNTAKILIEIMEKKAENMKFSAVISAADDSGSLIAMHFMDGALPVSLDVSIKKAYTAAATKISTEELGRLSQPGNPLYGINHANEKIIIFGGGQPLLVNGKVVGSLGVSGGTVEQDTELVNYGFEVFNNKFLNR